MNRHGLKTYVINLHSLLIFSQVGVSKYFTLAVLSFVPQAMIVDLDNNHMTTQPPFESLPWHLKWRLWQSIQSHMNYFQFFHPQSQIAQPSNLPAHADPFATENADNSVGGTATTSKGLLDGDDDTAAEQISVSATGGGLITFPRRGSPGNTRTLTQSAALPRHRASADHGAGGFAFPGPMLSGAGVIPSSASVPTESEAASAALENNTLGSVLGRLVHKQGKRASVMTFKTAMDLYSGSERDDGPDGDNEDEQVKLSLDESALWVDPLPFDPLRMRRGSMDHAPLSTDAFPFLPRLAPTGPTSAAVRALLEGRSFADADAVVEVSLSTGAEHVFDDAVPAKAAASAATRLVRSASEPLAPSSSTPFDHSLSLQRHVSTTAHRLAATESPVHPLNLPLAPPGTT